MSGMEMEENEEVIKIGKILPMKEALPGNSELEWRSVAPGLKRLRQHLNIPDGAIQEKAFTLRPIWSLPNGEQCYPTPDSYAARYSVNNDTNRITLEDGLNWSDLLGGIPADSDVSDTTHVWISYEIHPNEQPAGGPGSPPEVWLVIDAEHCPLCRGHAREAKNVLCDSCNRSYHLNCLGLARMPYRSFTCPACGGDPAGNNKSARRPKDERPDSIAKRTRRSDAVSTGPRQPSPPQPPAGLNGAAPAAGAAGGSEAPPQRPATAPAAGRSTAGAGAGGSDTAAAAASGRGSAGPPSGGDAAAAAGGSATLPGRDRLAAVAARAAGRHTLLALNGSGAGTSGGGGGGGQSRQRQNAVGNGEVALDTLAEAAIFTEANEKAENDGDANDRQNDARNGSSGAGGRSGGGGGRGGGGGASRARPSADGAAATTEDGRVLPILDLNLKASVERAVRQAHNQSQAAAGRASGGRQNARADNDGQGQGRPSGGRQAARNREAAAAATAAATAAAAAAADPAGGSSDLPGAAEIAHQRLAVMQEAVVHFNHLGEVLHQAMQVEQVAQQSAVEQAELKQRIRQLEEELRESRERAESATDRTDTEQRVAAAANVVVQRCAALEEQLKQERQARTEAQSKVDKERAAKEQIKLERDALEAANKELEEQLQQAHADLAQMASMKEAMRVMQKAEEEEEQQQQAQAQPQAQAQQ